MACSIYFIVVDPQRFPETVYADRFYQHYTTNSK